MSTTSEFLNLASLHGIGNQDLNGNDSSPKDRPGRYAYMCDAFGTRIFQYGRNCKGSAITMGELVIRLADIAATLTGGGTTYAVKAAAWTADKSVGELLHIIDNADSAGGAPEGEIAVVISNTAGQCNLDPNYPYTVAVANNDTTAAISPGWHWDVAAAGAKAQEVKGVAVGSSGITSLYYGWSQQYGVVPVAAVLATAVLTDRGATIAAAGSVDISAGSWELAFGYALGATQADLVAGKSSIFINCYAPTLNSSTP